MKQNPLYKPKHLDEHDYWTVEDLYEYAEVNGLLDAPIFYENVTLDEEYQGPNGNNLFCMSRPSIRQLDESDEEYMDPDDYDMLEEGQEFILIK